METKKKIEFRGGMVGLMIPFVIVVAGILWLTIEGKAMPMAYWVPTLAGIFAAIVLAKKPTECAEVLIEGMGDPITAIMFMAWMLAGAVAQVLKTTGLIEGLVWLCLKLGVGGAWFPAITFLCGSLLSTATGTALGTCIALAPILYPVGVALGASPVLLAGSIVSAAYFGDNIAPVSDTTIASAYSQGVGVAEVVRSRLKYAFSGAAIAMLGYIVFGFIGSNQGTMDLSFVGEVSAKGLIMLLVPALLIAMMYRGVHLIVALTTAGAFSLALGVVTGLLPISNILIVDLDTFSVGGVIVDGISGMMDICVFAFLLMGLVKLLERGGMFDIVIEALAKKADTPRKAELSVALIDILLCCLTVANSVVIVMEGPIAKRLLVDKFKITPDRSANILDACSCVAMCLVPYGFAPLLVVLFGAGSGAPVDFTPFQVCLNAFHGFGLGIVMLISMITGWGRTFQKDAQ